MVANFTDRRAFWSRPEASRKLTRCVPLGTTSFITCAMVVSPFPARRSTQLRTRKRVPRSLARQKSS